MKPDIHWSEHLRAFMRGLLWWRADPAADYAQAYDNVKTALVTVDSSIKLEEAAARSALTITAYIELLSAAYIKAVGIDPRDAVIVYKPLPFGTQIYITHKDAKP